MGYDPAERMPLHMANVFARTGTYMDLYMTAHASASATSTRVVDEAGLRRELNCQQNQTRIGVICQSYSWAPLLVSESMFRLFVTMNKSTQQIWDLAFSFRPQTSEVEVALSTCSWRCGDVVREALFNVKYPELKTYPTKETEWVIRQRGLYHQYSHGSKQDTWLLLFPNAESCSTKSIMDNLGQHPLQPHISFYFAHFHQWRWYMAELDQQLQNLADDLLNLEIERPVILSDIYRKMSSLRYIKARLSPLLPIFAAHTHFINMLRFINHDILARDQVPSNKASELARTLDSLEIRVRSLESAVAHLLSQADSTIQTASEAVSLKSQNITEGMSHHMLRDSASIRAITFVTLLYLPASFVSSFFGMGFFTTSDDDGVKWTVAPYTWIYCVVTIPLSIFTLVCWKWESLRTTHKLFTSLV